MLVELSKDEIATLLEMMKLWDHTYQLRGSDFDLNKRLCDAYNSEQSCRYCKNPDSILNKDTCCTRCGKLYD